MPALPSPAWNVAVPVHSKTAQSLAAADAVDPLVPVREDGVGVPGHLVQVGRPRGHRVAEAAARREQRGEVVGPVDRLEGPGPGGPVPLPGVPLLRAHRFRPFPWLLLRRLSASKVTTASSSGRTTCGLDELVRLGHEFDRRPPGREADGVAGEAASGPR